MSIGKKVEKIDYSAIAATASKVLEGLRTRIIGWKNHEIVAVLKHKSEGFFVLVLVPVVNVVGNKIRMRNKRTPAL